MSTLDDVTAGASPRAAVDAFGSGDCIAGRYRVHRRIADGGMGRVYEGEDLLLGGRLAIKVIRADLATQPRAVERFRREIHLARRIAHPNVCRVYDVALHRTARGELPVLTMELLAGETLAERIARGPLRVDEVWAIAQQLAAALDAAHAAGIVHRDLTATNVMLEPTRVVITDFGLATLAAPEPASGAGRVTTEGGFVGTPAYMAPEQVTGGELTAAVDVYALGTLLFEMITGTLPFGGDTPLAIAAARIARAAPRARTRVPELPRRWDRAIARCLALEPARRFARAGDVIDALGDPRRASRGRGWLATAAGVGVLAVALASDQRAPVPPRPLARPRAVAIVPLATSWRDVAIADLVGRQLAGTRVVGADDAVAGLHDLALAPVAASLGRLTTRLDADVVIGVAVGDAGVVATIADARGVERVVDAGDAPGQVVGPAVAIAGRIRDALGIELVPGDVARWLPADAHAVQRLAEANSARRAGDPTTACERVDDARSEHAIVRVQRALCLQERGEVKRATDELRAAQDRAELPPREQVFVRAAYLEAAGQGEQAIALLRTLGDDRDAALRIAALLTAARPHEALAFIDATRARTDDHPQLALAEATAAQLALDFARERAAAIRGRHAATARGARALAGQLRHHEGLALLGLADHAAARDALTTALGELDAAGDRATAATVRLELGAIHQLMGGLAHAHRLFDDASAYFAARRAPVLVAWTEQAIGHAEVQLGELASAEARFQRALAAATDDTLRAYTLCGLAAVRLQRGELDAATDHLERASQIAAATIDPSLQWLVRATRATILDARGQPHGARREWEVAARLGADTKLVALELASELQLATLDIATDPARAEAGARRLRERTLAATLPTWSVDILHAEALAALGKPAAARDALARIGRPLEDITARVRAAVVTAKLDAAPLDELRAELRRRGLVTLARYGDGLNLINLRRRTSGNSSQR